MLRSCVLGFIYRERIISYATRSSQLSRHLHIFFFFVISFLSCGRLHSLKRHVLFSIAPLCWRPRHDMFIYLFIFFMFLHCYQNLSHAEEVQSVDESGRADPYSAFNILLHMKPDVGLLAQFCMILFSVSLSLLQLHTSLVENHYSTKSLLNHIWK